MKRVLSTLRKIPRKLASAVSRAVGFRQSEEKLTAGAQRYWTDDSQPEIISNSHWKGDGGLTDDVWHRLGMSHLKIFSDFLPMTSMTVPMTRIVEWGCGGGANAVYFADLADEFVGVEVSQTSLDECGRRLLEAGHSNFRPILIETSTPESAIDEVGQPCDLFLCTFVFELLPSPAYGKRVLDIARRLLSPGGVALIQIKYETLHRKTRPIGVGYKHNVANMTTYPIDAFWELATDIGFTPRGVILQPKNDLVNDERYAYFVLER